MRSSAFGSRVRRGLVLGTVVALACGVTSAATARAYAAAPPPVAPRPAPQADVPVGERGRVFGAAWASSDDVAWTLVPSPDGVVVSTSSPRDGGLWHVRTSLAVPGVTSRQWVGHGCAMRGGRRIAVAFGPVEAISVSAEFERGAFAAVVDLDSGAVTAVPLRVTHAYFSPTCGADGTATFTSFGSAESTTAIHAVDVAGHVSTVSTALRGEFTDAVSRPDRTVVAVDGGDIVAVGRSAKPAVLAHAGGSVSALHVTGTGTLVYAVGSDDQGSIQSFDAGKTATLVTGSPADVGIADSGYGTVTIHGRGVTAAGVRAPAGVRFSAADVDAIPSLSGATWNTVRVTDAHVGGSVTISDRDGGERASVTVAPAPPGIVAARPAGPAVDRTAASRSSTTTDANLPCAVPRNDVRTEAYQPTVDQIEWAVDQAVAGRLTAVRPAGYRQFNLPAYSAQQLFPTPALRGGGTVPPQVLLGILANESNMWQASSHVTSGGYGNPLTGNVYGRDGDALTIDFSHADCGYGVGQVTDGMRTGQQSATAQRAIALDYQVNIAASLSILASKWNTLAGFPTPIRMNDGTSQWLENWYAAIWAYNTGIQPDAANGNSTGCSPGPTCTDAKGYWGLGWANNPANPVYPPARHLFNSVPSDAANPGQWPYQERVIGWAAYPIYKADQSSYTQAWWTDDAARTAAIPSPALFCTAANGCSGASRSSRGSCGRTDLHCWTKFSVTWKSCSSGSCGHAPAWYGSGDPEPADPRSADPAVCSSDGLPAGSVIVDDVPATTTPAGRPCAPMPTAGSFAFDFAPDAAGNYPAHVDLHQVNGGLNGHYWFTHTVPAAGVLASTGTWSFPRTTTGWGDVYIHVPALGAQTSQAHYQIIDGASGAAADRWVSEYWGANHWFRLGAYQFTAGEKIRAFSLSAHDTGSVDVAWDAVAFAPRAAPRYQIAVLGDSYTAGEGLQPYANDSDNQADHEPDGCHRSSQSYGNLFTLPGSSVPAAQRSDVDLRIAACSGAHTTSLSGTAASPAGGEVPFDTGWGGTRYEHGEAAQVQDVGSQPAASGVLGTGTSLVALTIGGNDARFAKVITYCTTNIAKDCNASGQIMPGDPSPLRDYEPHVINLLATHLAATYKAIHAAAPNASIYVVGYPPIFDTSPGSGGCNAISTGEEAWLDSMADLLNSTIVGRVNALAALGHKIYFVSTADRFVNHQVCDADEWINDVTAPSTSGSGTSFPSGSGSFHPKAIGQRAFASALSKSIAAHGV